MPATPELVVETDDGSTEEARLDAIDARRGASLTATEGPTETAAWGVARVDRADWTGVKADFDLVNDTFRIATPRADAWFAGRFAADEREGHDVEVVVASYERDAIDAEPTGENVVFQNVPDTDVVTDALGAVGTLSAGTVEQTSTASWTFSDASRDKQLRDAAEPGGADLRYNADRTVDYLDRRGTVRDLTLSPGDGRLVGDPTISDDQLDPVTHIKGLGAQSGPDRVRAVGIAPSFQAGDREVWREYPNKDVTREDRLQTIVDRLAAEFDDHPRRFTLEADLVDVDVDLGDTVTVDWPEHGINMDLRISTLIELWDRTKTFTATLTNRDPERGGTAKRRDDLERFNSGYQGFVDRDNYSIDNQPVTASTNAEDSYHYPDDVVTEKRAEVRVIGRAYRAYSSGAASGGGVTDTTSAAAENVTENSTSSAFSGVSSAVTSETVSSFAENQNIFASVHANPDVAAVTRVEIEDTDANETLYDVDVSGTHSEYIFTAAIDSSHTNRVGNTIEATVYFSESDSGSLDMAVTAENLHDHTVDLPAHTHDPSPGLAEFNLWPENVDVIVNGTAAGVSLGDGTGPFEATVDISGLLSPGDNTIEFTSDSTGRLTGAVRTELFRQGETT